MAALRPQHHSTFLLQNSVGPRSQSGSGVMMYALAILSTLVLCGISGSVAASGARPGSTSPAPSEGAATSTDVAASGASSETVDTKSSTTPPGEEEASDAPAEPSTSQTSGGAFGTSAPNIPASAGHKKSSPPPKHKLRLKLPEQVSQGGAGDMAPVKKHQCLKTFTEMVKALPKDVPVQEKANALVDAVQACGIKVVCADFDRTILTTHTGGAFGQSRLPELKGKLSQDFVAFAQALNKRGLRLHVVTFSDKRVTAPGRDVAGEHLVEAAISVNGDPFLVEGIVGVRPDVYTDPQSFALLGLDAPPPRNKSYHVKKVAERTGVDLDAILLVDDDAVNCAAHFRTGNLALHVGGDGFSFDNLTAVTSTAIV